MTQHIPSREQCSFSIQSLGKAKDAAHLAWERGLQAHREETLEHFQRAATALGLRVVSADEPAAQQPSVKAQSDLAEKVAKAIAEGGNWVPYESQREEQKIMWRAKAKDAIEALENLANPLLTVPSAQAQSDLVKQLRGLVAEHAQRLINRAFNNVGHPMPQLSIPADPKGDSDLIVSRGIIEAADRIEALEAAAVQPSEREAALVKALKECADDLSALVEHYYEKTKDYPSELRQYEIDIGPVIRARSLLAAYDPPAVKSEPATAVQPLWIDAQFPPAVTNSPNAPHDGRQQPRGEDLQAAEDRSIGMTAKAINEQEGR